MGNWAVSTPLNSDFISLGDDNIREMKTAIQESLRGGTTEGTEAVFPGDAPTTAPVFRYRGLKGATGARPTAGQYGLFFDTTRNALQRDNGSSWDDVGTLYPAGTVAIFFQASAPTGWTKTTDHNDKALRIVSGTGGGSGGTDDLSTPPSTAHVHTTPGHALTTDEIPSHHHTISNGSGSATGNTGPGTYTGYVSGTDSFSTSDTGSGSSHAHGDTGSTSPTAFAPKYIDVIACSKN